ncbi:hypothetical protein [Aliamphritea spongicola]|nr:hypothetical protein [Aliamphritea spongicola]
MVLIPLLALLFLVVAEQNSEITKAQDEVHGVEFIMPLRTLQQNLAEHRGGLPRIKTVILIRRAV